MSSLISAHNSPKSVHLRTKFRFVFQCFTPLVLFIILLLFYFTVPSDFQTTFNIGDNDKLRQTSSIDFPLTKLPDWKPFNNTNPHSKSWCPSSTTQCHNSPLCSPCNRRHLIIIATGRSGSTTLLRMLNLLPNVRLSGENANTLFVASRIVSNIEQRTGGSTAESLLTQNFDRTEGALMHNAIPKQTMACVMQHVLYALNPPPLDVQQGRRPRESSVGSSPTGMVPVEEYDRHTIVGMKTIRFHKGGPDGENWTPQEAARFLQEHFPCSRIVLNLRSDVKSQLSSIKGTFQKAKANRNEKSIEKMSDFLKKVDDLLPEDYSRLIDMTEWSKDVTILNNLVKWMGFENCEFQDLGHDNFNGFGRDDRMGKKDIGDLSVSGRSLLLNRGCQYPHIVRN